MIKYKEMEYEKYCNLTNKSGYYKTISYYRSEVVSVWFRMNDECHRLDGPAKMYSSKTLKNEFHINGKFITYNEQEFYESKQYKQWLLLENMKVIKGII